MTQKGNPYTKAFSTFIWNNIYVLHLAQLTILCSSAMKPYFTKMAIHLLFTVHKLRPLHAFSSILDLIEAKQSIHQNVQFFIWSKKSVFYFTAVRYSLHKCSERILWLKRKFTVHVSVTLDDLERSNSSNGRLISPISVAFGADCVKVVEDTPILFAAEM